MSCTLFVLAAILSRQPVELPSYESTKGIARYATAEEYAAAIADPRFRLEKVAYTSDGLRVFAYVYAPMSPSGKLPVVVYNRGSWVREEFAADLITTFRRLGEAGFVVVAPMIRGSGGGEGRDEMGGADISDVLNIRTVIGELPFADAGRVFMYGESRGGMMTFLAIRNAFSLRAAAVFGAPTELRGFPQAEKMGPQIWPSFAEERERIFESRSVMRWAERIDVPLLMMHGGSDELSPLHSLRLASRLEELGKPYELVIRHGERHVMTGWRRERDALAVEWFRRHDAK